MLCEAVIMPPYCGVPRLSHQLPVLVVVTDTAEVVADVDVVVAVVVLVAVVDSCAVVVIRVVVAVEVVAVVFEELQDARTRDKTKMPIRITQFLPLFIKSSSFTEYLGN
jgi:hypothetical protein